MDIFWRKTDLVPNPLGRGDSPESAAETIQAAAGIGLAGCSLEDHTGRRDDPIYDFTLAVERIEAAVEARRSLSHDFVLTARCENFLWGRPDLGDTILRLQAFERAGADVLYAPGLNDLSTIRLVCEAVTKPVNIVMGMPGATFGVSELAQVGVKRISVGSALARPSFGLFVNAARECDQQAPSASQSRLWDSRSWRDCSPARRRHEKSRNS